MSNAVGALDGKHKRIQCPPDTGTLFHNYKGFFSLVLMVVCNANYCFTVTGICQHGRNNDSGVLSKSEMGKRLSASEIHLPKPERLPGFLFDLLPFYLLIDEIFPLETWQLRVYSGKMLQENQSVYNYKYFHPRRVLKILLAF